MATRKVEGLDRTRIVEAAFEQLEAEGLDRLSMRELAARLHVQAPALYWHVANKAELTGLMAGEIHRNARAGVPAQPAIIAAGRVESRPRHQKRTGSFRHPGRESGHSADNQLRTRSGTLLSSPVDRRVVGRMRDFFSVFGRLASRLHSAGARRFPNWSKLSHTELGGAIDGAGWLREETFLAGPLRRYLEIGRAFAPEDPGDAARAMEYARGAIVRYRRELVERGSSGEAFDRRVWALVHRYLDDISNGDLPLAVLDGRATHNTRSKNLGPAEDRPFG